MGINSLIKGKMNIHQKIDDGKMKTRTKKTQ